MPSPRTSRDLPTRRTPSSICYGRLLLAPMSGARSTSKLTPALLSSAIFRALAPISTVALALLEIDLPDLAAGHCQTRNARSGH